MILLIQKLPRFSLFSHSMGKAAALLAIGLWLAAPQTSEAALYKCQVAGRTVYQDKECPGVKDSKPYQPKNPISTLSSESFTGKPKQEVDKRPAWLKPITPIDDCKAKGGTIDRDLKACMLP
jgi:hypothetical protein